MKNYLIGFFEVPGIGRDSVETLLTGDGLRDYAVLALRISQKYPNLPPDQLRRVGSYIERRDDADPGFIEETPGMTLRQLFPVVEGREEPIRRIGRVHFNGVLADVFLTLVPARGTIGVSVRPLLKSEGVANFHTQISVQRAVAELPGLLGDLFGSAGRDLNLFLRKSTKK